MQKRIKIFCEKGDPWGDLNAPEATSDTRFISILSDLIKYSDHIRIKYSQNQFESTFGSDYFKPNKTKLKLAKTVKKELRKSSFPWDIGLLFGKPMKYSLISEFNIFKIETEI